VTTLDDVLQILPWWAYALLACTALGLSVTVVAVAAALVWCYRQVGRLLGHPAPPDPLTAAQADLAEARDDAEALSRRLADASGTLAGVRALAMRWRSSADPVMRLASYDLEDALDSAAPARVDTQALETLGSRLAQEVAGA
jgi:hypothetical protein